MTQHASLLAALSSHLTPHTSHLPPPTSHLSPFTSPNSLPCCRQHMTFPNHSVTFASSPHFSRPASSHSHFAQSNRRASTTPPAARPRHHIRRNARQRRRAFTRRALPRSHLRRNLRACSSRNPRTRFKHSSWFGSTLQVLTVFPFCCFFSHYLHPPAPLSGQSLLLACPQLFQVQFAIANVSHWFISSRPPLPAV